MQRDDLVNNYAVRVEDLYPAIGTGANGENEDLLKQLQYQEPLIELIRISQY